MHAQPAPPAADPLIGRLVDERYRVIAEVGSGSVGTVFHAEDMACGGHVAIKLWRGCEDAQSRGRFVREAKALQTLAHANIVSAQALGFVDDSPYVVMELLEGQTLEAALHDGPFAPDRALPVARQILSAVAFAHERNVIHRDLKPENIFLTRDPQGHEVVKLLDYGLAKFLVPDDDPLKGDMITVTGMVMGTPLYMAPEQGAGTKVDLRADVYALGCIFFEMLTGRLPFTGDDFGQLLRAHLKQPIPKITDMLPDVRVVPELQAMLDAAMAKQPDERYPNASHMLVALESLPRPLIRPARPASSEPARRPPGEGPTRASTSPLSPNYMLISTLASAVILGTAIAFAFMR